MKNEQEKGMEEELYLYLPNEIFTMILLMLDGQSLHTVRQVSKKWNYFIKTMILDSVWGRKEIDKEGFI